MTSTRLAALVLALFAAGPAWSWQFKSTSDPMGRGTRHEATVTSSNSVNFPFPYAGTQRALLVLRSGPGHDDLDVVLFLQRAQFLCQLDDCRAAVRFDDADAVDVRAVGSSSHAMNVIFLRDEANFIEQARAAKRVKIEAEFYQFGRFVFDFPVSGLGDWPKSTPKAKAKSK